MNTIHEIIEESLLQTADMIAAQSEDQVSKIISDLFKSAVLEKYKVAYVQELPQGKVHKKNIDKTIEFLFADMCVSFRGLPGMTDEFKNNEIDKAKLHLGVLKEMVRKALVNKGVEVISDEE